MHSIKFTFPKQLQYEMDAEDCQMDKSIKLATQCQIILTNLCQNAVNCNIGATLQNRFKPESVTSARGGPESVISYQSGRPSEPESVISDRGEDKNIA